MSRAGVVPPRPPPDLKAWALHCNGRLEDGTGCLAVYQMTEPFPTARALRRHARKRAQWRVALTPTGLLDLCPACVERLIRAREQRVAEAARVELQ